MTQVFHTEGVPPSRGNSTLAANGSIANNSPALAPTARIAARGIRPVACSWMLVTSPQRTAFCRTGECGMTWHAPEGRARISLGVGPYGLRLSLRVRVLVDRANEHMMSVLEERNEETTDVCRLRRLDRRVPRVGYRGRPGPERPCRCSWCSCRASRARRATAPTPPCGPNLPADVKNVTRDSRCFELRTYTVREGSSIDLLHSRFRERTTPLFKKHGMTIIGYWQPVTKPEHADLHPGVQRRRRPGRCVGRLRGRSGVGENPDRDAGRPAGRERLHGGDGLLAAEVARMLQRARPRRRGAEARATAIRNQNQELELYTHS